MKLFKKFLSQKGFTLIELLIVIAILGVLAAAVLVAINPGQRIASARNSRVRADLVNLGNAANIFNTDTGLNAGCAGGGSYPDAFNKQNVCGANFPPSPIDPSGSAYILEKSPTAPTSCAPNTATPCVAISIEGPVYADGTVSLSSGAAWCWRSATGTIAQTSYTNCAP